jgi:hypothetical protein
LIKLFDNPASVSPRSARGASEAFHKTTTAAGCEGLYAGLMTFGLCVVVLVRMLRVETLTIMAPLPTSRSPHPRGRFSSTLKLLTPSSSLQTDAYKSRLLLRSTRPLRSFSGSCLRSNSGMHPPAFHARSRRKHRVFPHNLRFLSHRDRRKNGRSHDIAVLCFKLQIS